MSDSGTTVSVFNLCSHFAMSKRLDFSSGARALGGCEVEMATMATNATAANEAMNTWTRFS